MVKINHKKSEFGLNYNNVYRSVDNYWRNNWETFRYEDGSSLHGWKMVFRVEFPLMGII